jgi:hypothetical protein
MYNFLELVGINVLWTCGILLFVNFYILSGKSKKYPESEPLFKIESEISSNVETITIKILINKSAINIIDEPVTDDKSQISDSSNLNINDIKGKVVYNEEMSLVPVNNQDYGTDWLDSMLMVMQNPENAEELDKQIENMDNMIDGISHATGIDFKGMFNGDDKNATETEKRRNQLAGEEVQFEKMATNIITMASFLEETIKDSAIPIEFKNKLSSNFKDIRACIQNYDVLSEDQLRIVFTNMGETTRDIIKSEITEDKLQLCNNEIADIID